MSGPVLYLDAGAEQQQRGREEQQEDGAPGEAHAGGRLLPGGSLCSVEVGATLRSRFKPLRMGHAPAILSNKSKK